MICKSTFFVVLILTLSSSVFFAVADAQTIYWTDIGTQKIQRLVLGEGFGVQDLVTTEVITPVDIALDVVGGKIYWTEAAPDSVERYLLWRPPRPTDHGAPRQRPTDPNKRPGLRPTQAALRVTTTDDGAALRRPANRQK